MKRAGASVKAHAVSTIIASVIGVLTSTLIPMLKDWHDDAARSAEVQEAYERGHRELTEFKNEQAAKDKVQWEAIGRKQDKGAH